MRIHFVAMSFLVCATAHADPQPPPCSPSQDANAESVARSAFEEGEAAYKEGRYPLALEKFRESYNLVCHPTLRQAAAASLERLDRFREALEDYEAIANDPKLTDAQREEVGSAIARLRERVATLVVSGSPKGAQVFVDAEPRCRLPCRTRVDPGAHRVEIRRGAESHETSVNTDPGATVPVEMHLEAPPRKGREPRAPARSVPRAGGEESHVFWLTGIGVGLTVIGVAGVIGWGLRTRDLEEEYRAAAIVDDQREQGRLARDLTNASIAIGAAGLVCIGVDLVLYAVASSRASEPTVSRRAFQLRF